MPPQAVDVEQAVLGAMLIDASAIPKAIEIINEDSFYSGKHVRIFKAIIELFNRDEPADIITVSEELDKKGQLEDIGGRGYVIGLTETVATSAHIEEHCRIILEKSTLNSLITTSTSIISECYEASEEVDELLDKAEQQIFVIRESRLKQSFVKISDILPHTFEAIDKYAGKEGGITGIPSGFKALDAMTAGFQPSDLIIIASRPSMGKTAFSLAISENVAVKAGPVAFFSLEMSREQLTQRILCSHAKVSSHNLRRGRLKDFEYSQLGNAAGFLADLPIFIDDSPGIGVLEMKAKARRLKSNLGLSLVVIDYLQLMQSPKNLENRQQEIAYISRSLKGLAKELDVPVIALSQLSRQVEQRGGDRRPQLSDLRESGAIEQDADVVMFIYRPAFYGKTVDDEGRSLENISEIIIGKQRNGPTGTIELAFVRDYASFQELAPFEAEAAVGDEETPF
ncbi:MAG: replicative DNA helicase [candidate division Zixibacteria bacterium]|nr:replicative DNA helicase [candidate division Zixibacteria bacterium]